MKPSTVSFGRKVKIIKDWVEGPMSLMQWLKKNIESKQQWRAYQHEKETTTKQGRDHLASLLGQVKNTDSTNTSG